MNALTGQAKRNAVDACYSLWPKGNGDNHIQCSARWDCRRRRDRVKACVVWGQNPAVTEPNQGKIRDGSQEPRPLVVRRPVRERDRGVATARRTASRSCSRRAAHVEKAGSCRPTPVVSFSGATRPHRPLATARTTTSCCSGSPRRSTPPARSRTSRRCGIANGITLHRPASVVRRSSTRRLRVRLAHASFVGGDVRKLSRRRTSGHRSAHRTSTRPITTCHCDRFRAVAEMVFRESQPASAAVAPSGSTPRATTQQQDVAPGAANAAPGSGRHGGYYTPWSVANRAKSRDSRTAGQLRLPQVGLLVARQPPRALQQRRGPGRPDRLLHGPGLSQPSVRSQGSDASTAVAAT